MIHRGIMKLIVACCLLVFMAAEEKVAEQTLQPAQFGPAGAGQFPGLQGGQFDGQFAYPQYQNQFRYQTNPYQQPYQFPFQPQFTQFPYQQNPYQQFQYQQLPYQFPYQQNPYQQNPYQQNPYQQYPYFGQQQQFPTTPFFPQGSFAYGGQPSGQFTGQPQGQALGFQAPSREQFKK